MREETGGREDENKSGRGERRRERGKGGREEGEGIKREEGRVEFGTGVNCVKLFSGVNLLILL